MMPSPPSDLFALACKIYFRLAYPQGSVPANKLPFFHCRPDDPIATLLSPPVCERLVFSDGVTSEERGFAFRLGSVDFPHVKLQMHWQERLGRWLFAVDTHDAIHVPQDDPDHSRFQELRAKNSLLKRQIEEAWEAEGLMTFNASLRQELESQR